MNKSAPTMDEVWHTLPLGCPAVILARIATGWCSTVLCRHAPPLRWRETAVVFILCWHALPTSHATHAVRGLRQVLLLLFCVLNTPLFIILCWHALPTSHATHAVRGLRQVLLLLFCVLNTLLFIICVGTLCQRVMRLMPCGGYDKSSYYYFVFSTHCFLLFVLARFANESCDSCRAGATTSPLIIILCSQHTAFYYLCWHALPTSHATHAVRGLRQVLLLLFVFATHRFLLFTSSLIIILCLQHTAFLLFPPFLLARNVTVRGSRYSCCLGHRLLFPYMILFKLYICFKKKNYIGLSLTQASVVVPSKVIQAQVCSTRVRETNPGLGLNFQEILENPQQLGALHIYQSTPSIN